MTTSTMSTPLPRISIQFCTQCKWMLRAAYFAQELLSTFGNALGEVALQPSTGGVFTVKLYYVSPTASEDELVTVQEHLLWDRKQEGGFPETKVLKRLVRDIIEPGRDLGHVDGKKTIPSSSTTSATQNPPQATQISQSHPLSQTTTYVPSAYLSNNPPIPHALNRLVPTSSEANGERKFTPMDVDVNSQPASRMEEKGEEKGKEKEVVNERGKIMIGGGEGMGYCVPGGECEDCG